MRILLAYIRVHGEHALEYQPFAERFLKTYLQFRPEIAHELLIVDRHEDDTSGMFNGVATRHIRLDGDGMDCGTWVHLGYTIDSDLLVCLNATVYFWKAGWLERIVDAVSKHGVGLYGAFGSYENSPHLRTSCIAFQPVVMRDYPFMPHGKEDGYSFESGGWNFTRWCMKKGLPTILVTWDGEYPMRDFVKPENIFRRGDQSNCIVFDRHCDIYRDADENEKRRMETW